MYKVIVQICACVGVAVTLYELIQRFWVSNSLCINKNDQIVQDLGHLACHSLQGSILWLNSREWNAAVDSCLSLPPGSFLASDKSSQPPSAA